MVNPLDWVVSVVPAVAPGVDAVTLTGVLTVPELTVTTTSPPASEIAVAGAAGVSVMPPAVVLKPNVTVFPLIGFPPPSNTRKRTCAASVPPIPLKEMLPGVAETNWIDPVAGGVTTRLVEPDVTPAAKAVITSVPAQPLSRYEPVATPFTVATPVLKTALPTLAHDEEKVTFCGVLTGTPLIDTVTAMLVVPNAESGAVPTPSTGEATVTAATPTAKPIEPVAAMVPTWASAVIVEAPADVMVAGFSVTVATPEESVRAVTAGVMVASAASVLKVTTVFGTTPPAASLKVALTVAGAPMDIELTVAPAALLSAKLSVGTPGVEGVDGVAGVAGVGGATKFRVSEGSPAPGLHAARTASIDAKKSHAESLEVSWPKNSRAKKRRFFTQAPVYATRIDAVSFR